MCHCPVNKSLVSQLSAINAYIKCTQNYLMDIKFVNKYTLTSLIHNNENVRFY
jgi:hypothetical protein